MHYYTTKPASGRSTTEGRSHRSARLLLLPWGCDGSSARLGGAGSGHTGDSVAQSRRVCEPREPNGTVDGRAAATVATAAAMAAAAMAMVMVVVAAD